MTISELVGKLQKIKEEKGDMVVATLDREYGYYLTDIGNIYLADDQDALRLEVPIGTRFLGII